MTPRALCFALMAAVLPLAPARAAGPAPVVSAVIYPDRAQITRRLSVPCGQTPVAAVFEGLPWGLDETTLRAAASGGRAQVEGLSLRPRILQEALLEQTRLLDAQIEAVQAKIREADQRRARAVSSRAQAESLRASIPGFLAREAAADPKPQTRTWAGALDTARRLIEKADEERRAAETSLRELGRELEDLQRRRAGIASSGPTRTMQAEVLVRCQPGASARVELSYMAGGVSWQPVYEARALEAKGKLELSVLAQVVQATGEPWKGVEVTLSTAQSQRDATPPEPKRLYVGATPQEEKKKVLVRRYEEVSHLSNLPGGGEQAPAPDAAHGLSVQLEVAGRVDATGDGRPMRLLVSRHELPATFALLTVPKMAPFAFRSAEAINRTPFPLLPGRVDLFAGDSYLGHALLEKTARGDRIRLAFGIEEPIKVRRVVLEELAKDPGFLGSKRRLTYGYRIELASHARKATEVRVQEHVPVSQLDDVKVAIDEKTSPGYELQPDDGIVTWKVKLAPGEKKQLELRFAVEIPEEYDSSAL